MSVLQLKPHRLSYLVEEGGYTDTNGDYHKGTSRWEGNIRCDAVPAGASNEMQFEDGVTRKYSYTIYLPKDCRSFAVGEKVKISFSKLITRDVNGQLRLANRKVRFINKDYEFDVKGFHRYQMQCKLWV